MMLHTPCLPEADLTLNLKTKTKNIHYTMYLHRGLENKNVFN